jgi:AmmeMemoRadiSam system protein A
MSLDLSPFPPLTATERADLLRLARRSIRSALDGSDLPMLPTPTAALCEPAAAFVSLHLDRRLRGCIGTLLADRPLHRTVAHVARSAAFEDPRFQPLCATELPQIEIEISRLSPTAPACADDVCAGVHGVCVQHGDRRAVFLPQVAALYGWDRETLLAELCRKALLPPDAWRRRGTTLLVFATETFADGEGAEIS